MLTVIQYENIHEDLWDKFVLKESFNGNFLQSRKFLNYHHNGKFEDCSVIICDNNNLNNIYAVIPACREDNNFISHKGSTFGGIVVSKIRNKIRALSDIIDAFLIYINTTGYKRVLLKQAPDIFSSQTSDIIEYLLFKNKFNHYTELSYHIDFSTYKHPILSNFAAGKKENMKKCHKHNLTSKVFTDSENISNFYSILCENLSKFDAKPVHSIEELLDLQKRLPDNLFFHNVCEDNQFVAGGMCFYFENTNTYHTQYLASKQSNIDYNAMTYLYYSIIEYSYNKKYSNLSFGISTEDSGSVLNLNLAHSKESFGAVPTLNKSFYKSFN